jgi:hypothetical protein
VAKEDRLMAALRESRRLGEAAARGEIGIHAACSRAKRLCREAVRG